MSPVVEQGSQPEPVRKLPAPTRREVIDGLAEELGAGGIAGARHEAERILCHVLGISRTELLLSVAGPIEPADAGKVAQIVRRRLAGVPLQHIEGTVAFRDLVLVSDGRALVPRPETEQLVQLVVDWAVHYGDAPGVRRVRRSTGQRIPLRDSALDIGTGSGAISLSLVLEGIVRLAVGVDVSNLALEQAAENRARADLDDSVELRCVEGSPWDGVGPSETFDIIVCNPPYVTEAEMDELPREVREHDPHVALLGGVDGLDMVREIARKATEHLNPGGGLFLEIGERQGRDVLGILADKGPWKVLRLAQDLAGRDRFVIALT